jgi:spermidine/putrescine-binding protein
LLFLPQAGLYGDGLTATQAQELTECLKIIDGLKVELRSLRVSYNLLLTASGNIGELRKALEERIRNYETILNDLEKSNANSLSQLKAAQETLTQLKLDLESLKTDFDSYRQEVAAAMIENEILWIGDIVLGSCLLIYGLVKQDKVLIWTGTGLLGAGAIHYGLKIIF